MKIRELQLKNIGVFDEETIKFQCCPEGKAEIHIFTGQNGSGKTTILQSLGSVFDYYENTFSIQSLKNSLGRRYRNIIPDPEFKETNRIFVSFDDDTKSAIGFVNGFGHSELSPKSIGKFVADKFIYSLEMYRKYVNSTQNATHYIGSGLTFAAFAFSSYRQIESESVQANFLPKEFNPLSQSLEFIKDYRKENEITINQLITNNISNRALSKEDDSLEEAKRYEAVIKAVEKFIKDVTDYEVKFILKRSPNELKLRIHGEELDFDVLPDGLRSLISWIADLLGRVDLLKWQNDLPINEKNLILFLDEIEVHLHPAWQRKVLPVVQKLFKNSQIFVSTHSPFVVNSVDDAWVYKLELENGKARVAEIVESENSNSITQVLREVFGIEEWFGLEVQNNLERFKELKNKIISNGADENAERELLEKAKTLADEPNDQLKQLVRKDLEELSEIKNKSYTL